VSGLDYAAFKLFHLSILWRISVSDAEPFAYFKLEPSEEEEIRRMILAHDPGPVTRYRIMAVLLLLEGRVARSLIIPPFVHDVRGRRNYVLVFGGCAWFYFPDGSGVPRLDALTLTEDGRMEMRTRDLLKFGLITQLWREAITRNPNIAES
jgi:hypothetical protein